MTNEKWKYISSQFKKIVTCDLDPEAKIKILTVKGETNFINVTPAQMLRIRNVLLTD